MDTQLEQLDTLLEGTLFKTAEETEDSWKFAGIASDEQEDTEGDAILKSVLDLSYAQERGFVNWNHSRLPEDQIGFLTKAELLDEKSVREIEKAYGIKLNKTASIYIEGELYKYVDRAGSVQKIMKSAPRGYVGSLGLSIDGTMLVGEGNSEILKAFVRGVALTQAPAHTKTMSVLRKALKGMAEEEKQMGKSMSYAEAVLWILEQKPNWTYAFAQQVAKYALANKGKK